ncbi:MAG: hypothetical protein H8E40_03560 [Chloroflexi bacterium]|nr:hypothetical protein [Chloroflexota bacterium]
MSEIQVPQVSKQPRILNLDEFAPPETKFVYEGIGYKVQLLSTEAYLRFLRGREKAETASTDEEQALVGIAMLGMVVPSFPKEKAMSMPFPQLIKLLDWIQGLMEGDTKNLSRAVEVTAR